MSEMVTIAALFGFDDAQAEVLRSTDYCTSRSWLMENSAAAIFALTIEELPRGGFTIQGMAFECAAMVVVDKDSREATSAVENREADRRLAEQKGEQWQPPPFPRGPGEPDESSLTVLGSCDPDEDDGVWRAFLQGDTLWYEGDDPEGFANDVFDEFGLDIKNDPRNSIRFGEEIPADEDGATQVWYGFFCPLELWDGIKSGRWPIGS